MVKGILRGKKILVTSGSTRAPIDAVRFISNRSTGQLGTEIAMECLRRGAHVTFLHGTGSSTPESEITPAQKKNLSVSSIETFDELLAIIPHLVASNGFDAVFHAMAVLDYLPSEPIPGKIKSGRRELILKLAPAPKILPLFKKHASSAFVVGFKLEVDILPKDLWARAHKLIENSGADLVVANLIPFANPEAHTAFLIRPDFAKQIYPPEEIVGKKDIAWAVVEEATMALTS